MSSSCAGSASWMGTRLAAHTPSQTSPKRTLHDRETCSVGTSWRPEASPVVTAPWWHHATIRADRPGAGGRSAEVELGRARPLDLEEQGVRGDRHHAVPELAGLLAARRLGDHRAEEGGAAEVDRRGADVVADGVHAFVVGGLDLLVVGRVVPGLAELPGQARVLEGGHGHRLVGDLLLDVDAGAHRRVERQEHLVAVLLGGGDAHADGPPCLRETLAVVLGDVLLLVEVGQAHHVPADVDLAHLLDLANPARGDPGEGAAGVEPEVGMAVGGRSHTWCNPDEPRKDSRFRGAMIRPMPGTNLTRDEAQDRARLLEVDSYTVELDLTCGETIFTSTTTIDFRCSEPGAESFADLVKASIDDVRLNDVVLDPDEVYADNRILLTDLQSTNRLVVRAHLPYSRTGEGLHRFVDPADKRVYTYTQFEVPDARRVYATFEQPDLKSVFTFHVQAPEDWVVVSNAPTPQPEPRSDGTALWRFPPTERISTYITAVVAGEYHAEHTTYHGKFGKIPLGHYCRQSLVEHLDVDALVRITEHGFAFFEEAFDFPYPFHKYDQLYVPEYNMGAMENAGAVTLRDEYLPRSRQDASFYEFRATVILHEMAHMWFGDLVTMKWWDDLWLNESFAEWACYLAAVEATEFTEAWTGFANARKNWALRQDQLPSTHPIAADNYDLQAVEVNFDGITYAKGASVLKQLVAWVGLDNFLVGLRSYFSKHAFGNSEFSDLLSALEEASGRELDSWAKEWLQTSGVNTLTPAFEVDEDGCYTSFSVIQTAVVEHPTLRRNRIGIGLYDTVQK